MIGNILAVSLMSLSMGINGLKDQPKERLTDNTITDLTDYQWVANDNLGFAEKSWNINFTSNETEYTVFYVSYGNRLKIYYNSTEVYSKNDGGGDARYDPLRAVGGNGWVDEAYKTIQITGGEDITDTDLITYLQENGTLTYIPQEDDSESSETSENSEPTPTPSSEGGMGADIIGGITSGLGIISPLALSFLTGFGALFWDATNQVLSPFAIFSLVMLGLAISFAIVKLVMHIIRSNTGA